MEWLHAGQRLKWNECEDRLRRSEPKRQMPADRLPVVAGHFANRWDAQPFPLQFFEFVNVVPWSI